MANTVLDPNMVSLIPNGEGTFDVVGADGGSGWTGISVGSKAPVQYNGHVYMWNPDGTLLKVK